MKRTDVIAVMLSALILFIFTACHTETPLGIDKEAPQVEIMYIYNGPDTLYNYTYPDSSFKNFSDTLLTELWSIKAKVLDNQEIFEVKLIAEDVDGSEYEINKLRPSDDKEILITSYYKDYPITQDSLYQDFYLKLAVSDESENVTVSAKKLGFRIAKPFPMLLFHEELGLVEEIEGDSIDFREKNGKLAFVQFMYKGCLSCVDEAMVMKDIYADPDYDNYNFSHSLFGRKFDDEEDYLNFKKQELNRAPFDCFFDQPENRAKAFFEKMTGEVIETAVFAIMPNGTMEEYDPLLNFEEWVIDMFHAAYPNN